MQKKCLTPNIVYQADITNNVDDERRVYLGLSETPFKDKYRDHVRDFNNEIRYNKTEFSKYVWDLKRNNKETLWYSQAEFLQIMFKRESINH